MVFINGPKYYDGGHVWTCDMIGITGKIIVDSLSPESYEKGRGQDKEETF